MGVNNRATDATASPRHRSIVFPPLLRSTVFTSQGNGLRRAARRPPARDLLGQPLRDQRRREGLLRRQVGCKGLLQLVLRRLEEPHPKSNLAAEIAKASQHIKNSLDCVDNLAGMTGQANKQHTDKMKKLESENKALKKVTEDLKALVLKLEGRVEKLEKGGGGGG